MDRSIDIVKIIVRRKSFNGHIVEAIRVFSKEQIEMISDESKMFKIFYEDMCKALGI